MHRDTTPKPPPLTPPRKINLVGGALCLDFANSVDDGEDYLEGFPALVAWSRHAGTLGRAQAERLAAEAARRPGRAQRVLRRARRLRSAIRRIFSGVAAGSPPAEADVSRLNRELAIALRQLRLEGGSGGFRLDFCNPPEALDRMLWPVARSAAELLAAEERQRVKQCDADNCDWLFLDASRNHRRRWCDMASCGNRAKARRHYRRQRGRG